MQMYKSVSLIPTSFTISSSVWKWRTPLPHNYSINHHGFSELSNEHGNTIRCVRHDFFSCYSSFIYEHRGSRHHQFNERQEETLLYQRAVREKQSTYGNQEQSWQIFLLTIARSTLLCYIPKKDNKNKKTKECFIKNSISSSCFPAIFFPFTVSYCHTYTETDLVGTI